MLLIYILEINNLFKGRETIILMVPCIEIPLFYAGRDIRFSSSEGITPSVLSDIADLNKDVFGGSRTIEQISQRLTSYGHPHFTIARYLGQERADVTRRNGLVAYGMGHEEHGKYYLWMLGVTPGFRSEGVGSEILNEQIGWAREEGYKTFFLKTSNKWRDMLRLVLSPRFEFDITGFKANEWGTDSAIWLEKKLKD